ncbi:MAG: hypothetical protein ACREGA_03770 [Candidatus Saccharimonadales bacterium]
MRACAAAFVDGFDPEKYMGRDDFERFLVSHLDPNVEVSQVPGDGKRFSANQGNFITRAWQLPMTPARRLAGLIARTMCLAAVRPDEPHNESPEARRLRLGKRLSGVSPASEGRLRNRNYLHFREIYTDATRQGQGVARRLGKRLVRNAPLQPVTAYFRPDIYRPELGSYLQNKLEALGFAQTGEVEQELYAGSQPTKMLGMQAPSAFAVWRQL